MTRCPLQSSQSAYGTPARIMRLHPGRTTYVSLGIPTRIPRSGVGLEAASTFPRLFTKSNIVGLRNSAAPLYLHSEFD